VTHTDPTPPPPDDDGRLRDHVLDAVMLAVEITAVLGGPAAAVAAAVLGHPFWGFPLAATGGAALMWQARATARQVAPTVLTTAHIAGAVVVAAAVMLLGLGLTAALTSVPATANLAPLARAATAVIVPVSAFWAAAGLAMAAVWLLPAHPPTRRDEED
jgi:hypothetical protein